MAYMIPAFPKDFDPRSHEGIVFDSLKKLPNNYWVFHSVSTVGINSKNTLYEREIDFLVADVNRGFLVLEVKAGDNISYKNRIWYYSNGLEMSHGGPYKQAQSASKVLMHIFKDHYDVRINKLVSRCKFLHAVFFPDMHEKQFKQLEGLPEEADLNFTLCFDDLADPSIKINHIFSIFIPVIEGRGVENFISKDEFQIILDKVLCPHFHLIPLPNFKTYAESEYMNQLLREQYLILDFLDDQKFAVINGAAGTGKTMLAVEKARRHSLNGEKVLFLCYNRLLRDKLISDYKNSMNSTFSGNFENVEFMTISALARKVTNDYKNYDGLLEWLLDCIDKKKEFGFQHIIIDEGQDFGLVDSEISEEYGSNEENVSIIDALQDVAISNNGTFYLFYDKYQMIQGGGKVSYTLPNCINYSDCKLTLHRNCRNTKEIIKTSFTTIKNKKEKFINILTASNWNKPIKPIFHFLNNYNRTKEILDNILNEYEKNNIEDVVILSANSINNSILVNEFKNSRNKEDGYFYYKCGSKWYKATTNIKFKGLEAEAIIMIDINKNSFIGEKGLEFYVGSSRARYYLDIIGIFDDDDYGYLVRELDEKAPIRNNPSVMRKILGNILGVDIKINN